MRCSLRTHVGIGLLCVGWIACLSACGASDASLATSDASLRDALQADPAGRVSIISKAASELPVPEPALDGNDDPIPPPTCEQAQAAYAKAFTELSGMVEYHGIFSLNGYKLATRAAVKANAQNCAPAFTLAKSCEELVGTFNEGYASLVATPEYQKLNATIEWHTVLTDYQTLKTQGCIE